MSTMFFTQSVIVLLCILIDAQVGGVGLSVLGGVGLVVLAFDFHLEPTSPPIDVMLMIMAVVSIAALIQTSGGSDYMTKIATRVLHRNPKYIIFIAPAAAYLFAVLTGAGHVAYSVLPVIAEVNRRNGIRPSRPLTTAVIASQFAIVASPIVAAVVACVTYPKPQHITMVDVLKVTVPSTIFGIGLACVFVNKLGEELKDDPRHQELLAKPECIKAHEKDPTEHTNLAVSPQAKLSVGIFLAAVLLVVMMGAVLELRPTFQTGEGPELMGIAYTIEIVMFSAVTLIILFCKPNDNTITRGLVFHAEMHTVIAVFGVVWLGDTLIYGHLVEVKDAVSHSVETAPWTFAAALFVLFVLVNGQGAAAAAPFPIAVSLNIPVLVTIGTSVVVNGYFFIPNYGPITAAIDFNSTGLTEIGKYIFNHSFVIPGLLNLIFGLTSGLMFTETLLRTRVKFDKHQRDRLKHHFQTASSQVQTLIVTPFDIALVTLNQRLTVVAASGLGKPTVQARGFTVVSLTLTIFLFNLLILLPNLFVLHDNLAVQLGLLFGKRIGIRSRRRPHDGRRSAVHTDVHDARMFRLEVA